MRMARSQSPDARRTHDDRSTRRSTCSRTRFEGSYASTTITVMGDRSGFVWADPPVFSKVDELVAAKWKRMKILPSGTCNDSEFIRRVFLDLYRSPPQPTTCGSFLPTAATVVSSATSWSIA